MMGYTYLYGYLYLLFIFIVHFLRLALEELTMSLDAKIFYITDTGPTLEFNQHNGSVENCTKKSPDCPKI